MVKDNDAKKMKINDKNSIKFTVVVGGVIIKKKNSKIKACLKRKDRCRIVQRKRTKEKHLLFRFSKMVSFDSSAMQYASKIVSL